MARKPRTTVTDDQIVELIKSNPTMSNRAIAMELGMSVSGPTNTRIKQLRATINGEAPIGPTLNFSDIRVNDRLLRAGKRLVVVSAEESYIRVRRMDGSAESISRKDFSQRAAEYTKVPFGDSQGGPVTTYHIPPGTEPGKDAPTELTEGERTEMEGILEGLKEEIEPKKPLFEPVDYIDPEWGVTEPEEPMDEITIPIKLVAGNRPYLDRISHLLDIVLPDCTANMVDDTVDLAVAMLVNGIREEARHAQ